jgi:preprotein translocase subunit SecG
MLFFVLSLALVVTWLVLLQNDRVRNRSSCFGNRRCCSTFTIDIVFDAILSVLWLALFIAAIVLDHSGRWYHSIGGMVVSVTFAGTAGLSHVLRSQIQANIIRVDHAAWPPQRVDLSAATYAVKA